MHPPYIGVTGFMTPVEIHEVAGFMPPGTNRKLMVGVLASYKTLNDIANKWPSRYPKMSDLSKLFATRCPNTLNLIHYATDEASTLSDQLLRLVEIAGENLDGFQLNVCWPPISELERFYEATNGTKKIVLQIGIRAMMEAEGDHGIIADWVGHYVPMMDYVLVDLSGGLGKPFVPHQAILFLRAISDAGYPIGLGVAGGFGPGNMHHLGPVASAFPTISIDAEGKLRSSHPEDRMMLCNVRQYIDESFEFFSKR